MAGSKPRIGRPPLTEEQRRLTAEQRRVRLDMFVLPAVKAKAARIGRAACERAILEAVEPGAKT